MITFCCSDNLVFPSQRVKIGGMKPVVLKSKFSQVLGWSFLSVLAISTVLVGLNEGLLALIQTLSWTVALGLLLIELLIRPKVELRDQEIIVTNPFRSHTVPWGAIERIDTKWGLTVFGNAGKVQAWSAPAPGRHSSLRATKFDGKHLPESSYLAGTIRPGDLVGSDSGAAAYAIRSEWERRRDLGALQAGQPQTSELSVRSLLLTIACFGIALVLNSL